MVLVLIPSIYDLILLSRLHLTWKAFLAGLAMRTAHPHSFKMAMVSSPSAMSHSVGRGGTSILALSPPGGASGQLRVDPLGKVHYDGSSDDSDVGEDDASDEGMLTPEKTMLGRRLSGDASAESGDRGPETSNRSAVFFPATHLRPKIPDSKIRYNPPNLAHAAATGFFDEGVIVVFGGNHTKTGGSGISSASHETWIYHIPDKRWECLNNPGEHTITPEVKTARQERGLVGDTFPPPRCGHCVCGVRDVKDADPVSFTTPEGIVAGPPVPKRDPSLPPDPNSYQPSMLMFGGANLQQGTYFNDLWIFDVKARAWTQLFPLGTKPTPRWQCVSGSLEQRFFVFGGEGSDFGVLNDLHMYDHLKGSWVELRVVEPVPPPRMLHSATTVGDKMVVVGGIGKSTLTDVWILEMRTLLWRKLNTEHSRYAPFFGGSNISAPVNPAVMPISYGGGPLPIAQSIEGHTIMGFDDCIVLHGGKIGKVFNRYVWGLSLQTGEWSILAEVSTQENKTAPQARWQHCACPLREANPTHSMKLAMNLNQMKEQRLHLTEENEMKTYMNALASKLARQITFEGVLMTHGSKPIMVRTVSAYIFGGAGYPRQFSDLWRMDLIDPAANTMYDMLTSGKTPHPTSTSPSPGRGTFVGIPQAAVVADTEQLAHNFFFDDSEVRSASPPAAERHSHADTATNSTTGGAANQSHRQAPASMRRRTTQQMFGSTTGNGNGSSNNLASMRKQ